ncbi:MAG: sugar ABC transporter substrate-binding protein [Verrucomicrobia bacterium]|nr:sugar ABC transporter substrate-binding protein [Verrucomicrobiota bacterium]
MKKHITIGGAVGLFIFCAIGFAVLTSGCGPKETGEPDKPRVALIMKSLANEFFMTMENGARDHHKSHKNEYKLVVNGIKNELDVSKQIDLVDQMIAQQMDAIVIAPADSKALVPVCRKAVNAGIVVVNIDNKFDDAVLDDQELDIPFVGPDNRKGARKVGEYLANRLDEGDKVTIIEGAPNTFNGIQRKLGFEDAMNAAGMQIVGSQSGYWETDKANKVAAAMITEYPELKAILCANDSMALGAISALRAAGKTDEIKVVGFDNISAAQQLLESGRLLATADQHADMLAVYGIEYALEIIETGQKPQDRETPVDLITAESISAETDDTTQ